MAIPLTVIAVPTIEASLNNDSFVRSKSKTIAVDATPTEVVEIPDIIPKSPVYPTSSIVSIEETTLGSPIKTAGALTFVYAKPVVVPP